MNASIGNTGIARLEYFKPYRAKTRDTANPRKHILVAILQKINIAGRFQFNFGSENAYDNARNIPNPITKMDTIVFEDTMIQSWQVKVLGTYLFMGRKIMRQLN